MIHINNLSVSFTHKYLIYINPIIQLIIILYNKNDNNLINKSKNFAILCILFYNNKTYSFFTVFVLMVSIF